MHRLRPLHCLLFGALLLCTGAGSLEDRRQTVTGPVAAELLRVIDGDTIEVRARIWLELDLTTRVRLAGIDAPELNGGCAEERRLAQVARTALGEAIGLGPLRLANIRHDKYGGRVTADVLLEDGSSAAAAMLASGAAAEWGSSPRWCPR
jgi:endonuclease YncB( thermonuclease family)